MSEHDIFLGGIPTKPDVDKLRNKFGVPEVGILIPWDAISEIIGCRKEESRFHTITTAWRKALEREHEVIMEAIPGKGLSRLNPDGKMELAGRKRRQGARCFSRSAKIVSITDKSKLTEENRRLADHIERSVAAVRLALATESKRIELPSQSRTR